MQDEKTPSSGGGLEPREANKSAVKMLVAGFILVPLIAGFFLTSKCTNPNRTIMLEGTPATATVKDVVETGNYYNRQPEVRVRFDVDETDGGTYIGYTEVVWSMSDFVAYPPGTRVRLKVDPEQRAHVVLMGPLEKKTKSTKKKQ